MEWREERELKSRLSFDLSLKQINKKGQVELCQASSPHLAMNAFLGFSELGNGVLCTEGCGEGVAMFARGLRGNLKAAMTLKATEQNFQKGKKQNLVIEEGYTSMQKQTANQLTK